MISVSGRVMAGVVLITIIISGWFAWRLLWPPIPSDRGLAAIQDDFPDADVACLLAAIESEPERFRVDESFYLEPFNDRLFYLRDRSNRHAVRFSTGRTLSYEGFYGTTGFASYGEC